MAGPCGEDCESDAWLLGVKGVCNATTALCECPAGFDGVDDFAEWNSCHVSQNARNAAHAVVAAVAVVQMLSAGIGMYYTSRGRGGVFVLWLRVMSCTSLIRERTRSRSAFEDAAANIQDTVVTVGTDSFQYGLSSDSEFKGRQSVTQAPLPQDAPAPRSPARATPPASPVTPSRIQPLESPNRMRLDGGVARQRTNSVPSRPSRSSQTQFKQIQEATYRQFGLLFLFWVFGLSTFVYEVMMLMPEPIYRKDCNLLQMAAFTLAVLTMLCGLWQVCNMLFKSLPSMRFYGPLFGVNSLFVRYPDLVPVWTALLATVTGVGVVLTTFILPIAKPEDADLWDTVALLFMAAVIVFFMVTIITIYGLLSGVYLQSLIALRSGHGRSRDPLEQSVPERAFLRARTAIRAMLLAVILVCPIAIAQLVAIATVDAFRRNVHLSFTALAVAGHLGAFVLTYLLVYRSMVLDRAPLFR